MNKTGIRLTGAGLAGLFVWVWNEVMGGFVHYRWPEYPWSQLPAEVAVFVALLFIPILEHWFGPSVAETESTTVQTDSTGGNVPPSQPLSQRAPTLAEEQQTGSAVVVVSKTKAPPADGAS